MANTSRYYANVTYYQITETKVTGGKIQKTTAQTLTNIPIIFGRSKNARNEETDGVFRSGLMSAWIPSRFFEVYAFSPSLRDIIERDSIKYRIIDIRDYTNHPHMEVYGLTLRRIEYSDG